MKALICYVVWRAGRVDGFGAIKLNKVLWFAEARHFMAHGRPITGETFVRQKFGPVPKHVQELKLELETSGEIIKSREDFLGHEIERFYRDAPADSSMFTAEELQMIDWWIKHVAEEHTAHSISELSHNYTWQIAAPGEEIPLYAVFAARIRAPIGKELEWARAEAERLGLV